MALKDLSTQDMVSISAAWLDPKQKRPLLEGSRLMSALLPQLEQAHTSLLSSQVTGDNAVTDLSRIQEEEAQADALHDRLARGTYNLLTGLADLTGDDTRRASYLDLRDHLMPIGLRLIRLSYNAEAGEAKMIDERLDDADRTLLNAIALPEGKLSDRVEAWKGAGEALGRLVQKRNDLPKEHAVTAGECLRARNDWVQVVHLLLDMSAVKPALDAETHQALFGVLEEVEAQAARAKASAKAAAKAKAPKSPSSGTPSPAKTGS